MKIDNEMRQAPFYKQMAVKIQEGYFIEKSKNLNIGRTKITILYTFKKVNEDGTRSINCYLAHDVATAISKEFNTEIVEDSKENVWLNDNPEHYKPHAGHKITYHI